MEEDNHQHEVRPLDKLRSHDKDSLLFVKTGYYVDYFFVMEFDEIQMNYFVEIKLPPGNHIYSIVKGEGTEIKGEGYFNFKVVKACSLFVSPEENDVSLEIQPLVSNKTQTHFNLQSKIFSKIHLARKQKFRFFIHSLPLLKPKKLINETIVELEDKNLDFLGFDESEISIIKEKVIDHNFVLFVRYIEKIAICRENSEDGNFLPSTLFKILTELQIIKHEFGERIGDNSSERYSRVDIIHTLFLISSMEPIKEFNIKDIKDKYLAPKILLSTDAHLEEHSLRREILNSYNHSRTLYAHLKNIKFIYNTLKSAAGIHYIELSRVLFDEIGPKNKEYQLSDISLWALLSIQNEDKGSGTVYEGLFQPGKIFLNLDELSEFLIRVTMKYRVQADSLINGLATKLSATRMPERGLQLIFPSILQKPPPFPKPI